MIASVVLVGPGLHGGRAAKVTLLRDDERAVTLRIAGVRARVGELVVVGTDRATTVAKADGTARLATVEHLFAALAGLGIRAGLTIDVEGDELPLLDGAAAAWTRALATLGIPPAPPTLVVRSDGELRIGCSTYVFGTAGHGVRARFETDDPRLASEAVWSGKPAEFAPIAAARTFAFASEIGELASRGLASHVAKESVVVIAPDEIHSAGPEFLPDEPARHKLLDLVGDLYLYGGPPRGSVTATRPGHASTHAAVRRALDEGILTRTGAPG